MFDMIVANVIGYLIVFASIAVYDRLMQYLAGRKFKGLEFKMKDEDNYL